MKQYLIDLLTEKGIDLNESFIVETESINHVYEYGQLIDDIAEIVRGRRATEGRVRATLVQIDFQNGDITHYLKHLAAGLVAAYGGAR